MALSQIVYLVQVKTQTIVFGVLLRYFLVTREKLHHDVVILLSASKTFSETLLYLPVFAKAEQLLVDSDVAEHDSVQ